MLILVFLILLHYINEKHYYYHSARCPWCDIRWNSRSLLSKCIPIDLNDDNNNSNNNINDDDDNDYIRINNAAILG